MGWEDDAGAEAWDREQDAADYAAYLADRERSEPFDLDAYAADFAARYPQGVES